VAGFEKVSESAAHYAIHHFVVPWLLVPVFSSGLMIVGLFVDEKLTKRADLIMAWCFGGMAVLGTIATILVIRWLRRRPADWRLFHLGRGSWVFLFSVAWLAGVGCGVFVFNG
jgi:hypothetical protein